MQLSRQEFFAKQRELSGAILRAEQEAARRIHAATRELVLPLVRQYAEQGMITYPTEELARQIDHIIREEAAKPVAAVRKLQDDMEASLAEKLGVNLRPRPEPQENARQRRLENAREPVGTIIKTPGRGWGYGTSGLAAYHRDPQTGKIVWDDLPLEYQFRKRADLSEQVWKAVEEQERMVFDVIRGGRAAGRNVKEVCGDIETFINYQDGGKRVVGRWGKMFPNTEEGRREAWKREYLTAHGGLQPGSDAAKALLRQPDAQAWVKQKMVETTKRGTPRLPSAVKQYATRLGKAGLDHRAIRIAKDETNSMIADEQVAIAENSDICTGEMDFVLERGRDAWSCNCQKYAEQSPWRVDDPERPEIPIHPNCVCEWRPRLKTDAEILAALREEMAEDLATLEGTDEQKGIVEWIDQKQELFSDNPYNENIYKFLESENAHNQAEYEYAMEKIHKALDTSEAAWIGKLTKEENYAVDSYTSDDYFSMNAVLLGEFEDDGLIDMKEITYKNDECFKALEKFSLEEDIVTWKGTEAKYYTDYEKGYTIEYPAFHSTSVDFNKARDSDMLIQFRLPKGTHGAYLANTIGLIGEDEFLIQKGLNYKVIERGKIMQRGVEKDFMILQVVGQ